MAVDYQARMQRLLDATDADAVALVPGSNMVYFTGLHYHLSERPIIGFVTRDGLAFITPQLEATKLTQRPDLKAQPFVWTDTEGYTASFKQAVEALNLSNRSLGVDGQTMRVFEWLALAKAGTNLDQAVDIGDTFLTLRSQKAPEEIEAMRKAIQLSEKALQQTLDWAKPGHTEREISTYLESALQANGSEGNAFGPLVLTGPKTALPHGNTGDRPLGENEFLLIDFGGLSGSYPADITRTFCLGTPTDDMRKMYTAVYDANAAARAVAKPGVTCGEVDRAARDVIEAAGYGEYFTHRTGHGLGLDIHELPQIASGVEAPLAVGNVFTIEPGIYIPEIGGVRIEDNVVVTEDGVDVLTSYSRELA